MALRLVVIEGSRLGKQLKLDKGRHFDVGSSPMASLTIDHPSVAGIHLKLVRRDAADDRTPAPSTTHIARLGRATNPLGSGTYERAIPSDNARWPAGRLCRRPAAEGSQAWALYPQNEMLYSFRG